MLKTTKEFDFVYKNSYKFRSESLDICVLRANMAGQFFAKFRRLPCNLIGFSVSKKVGIAVERNLIKRRLRAICREFFSPINSSLGMQFRTCGNFEDSAESASFGGLEFRGEEGFYFLRKQKVAKTFRFCEAESAFKSCDSTHNSPVSRAKNKGIKGAEAPADFLLELRKESSESKSKKIVGDSKVAKIDCHEFANANSRNDERGARFANSRNDERGARFANSRNGERGVRFAKTRNDDMVQNLVCIFIAKGQILQIPFATLKNNIFATLKKQLNFRQNRTAQNRPAQNRPHKITQKGML